jgi:hypothetical protein
VAKGKSKNWSLEDLSAHYARQGKPVPQETQDLLQSLGLGKFMRPLPAAKDPGTPTEGSSSQTFEEALAEVVGKRDPKSETRPVFDSLQLPLVYAKAVEGPDATLSLWFDGARLLTVNQLILLLKKHWSSTIPYKKLCRKMVKRALEGLPEAPPVFDGPTRLWLYRRGKNLVDLDSLPTMFKYAIDSLRAQGVISDDNPQIIVEIKVVQEKGLPALGMRLERLKDWAPPEVGHLKQQWLGLPGEG